MRKLNFVVAASVGVGLGFVASTVSAAPAPSREAHICSTRHFTAMSVATDSKYKHIKLDDATVFECPAPIGNKTLSQLAAAGWQIGNPLKVPAAVNVGKDLANGGPPMFTWKVLIQRKL